MTLKEYNIPFIYYGQKEINIAENQEKINLEFKLDPYNNDPLYLYQQYKGQKYITLENWKKEKIF